MELIDSWTRSLRAGNRSPATIDAYGRDVGHLLTEMNMTNENDPLGDLTPASFHASPDWWRRLVDRLDQGQLEQLRAGELSYVAMGTEGMEIATESST